jgi:hypothetical protein
MGPAPVLSYPIFRQIFAGSRQKSHFFSGMGNHNSCLVPAKDDRTGRLAARERLIRDADGLQLAVAENSLVEPVRDDLR